MTLGSAFDGAGVYPHLLHPVEVERYAAIRDQRPSDKRGNGTGRVGKTGEPIFKLVASWILSRHEVQNRKFPGTEILFSECNCTADEFERVHLLRNGSAV